MSINRSRLFSNNLAHSVSDTVPQSSMTMLLRITSSYFQLCSSNWNNSYRTHLGSRNRQKTLQPQPFPTILATHSRSAQDCSYAGTSSLWPCALPVELSWDSAPEHSCSTKGQDLKQVLKLGLVRSVTFSVPMGFHTASKGLSLPTNSQTAVFCCYCNEGWTWNAHTYHFTNGHKANRAYSKWSKAKKRLPFIIWNMILTLE